MKKRAIDESYEPELVAELIELEDSLTQAIEDLKKKLSEEPLENSTKKQILQDQVRAKEKEYAGLFINFALANPNSNIGTDFIYRNRHKINIDVLNDVFKKLNSIHQNSEVGVALNLYLNSKLIKEGSAYLNIRANSLDGFEFNLSELIGNNIVLVFWSAGCKHARMLNRYLSANYEDINPEIRIVGYFVGSSRSDWEKASHEDKIRWYNVSDLSGKTGKINALYDIQGTPITFLIDKKGIVTQIHRGSREGLIEIINGVEAID